MAGQRRLAQSLTEAVPARSGAEGAPDRAQDR
jgi:hypothetical protein